MRKKALIYLFFFVLLLAGFYAALMLTTDFAKVKLPILKTVQPFSFLRQDSVMVSKADVKNRVYVAEYFFYNLQRNLSENEQKHEVHL